MSTKERDQEDLVRELQRLTGEFGRRPTRIEFESNVKGGKYRLEKHFRTYTALLSAAGIGDKSPLLIAQEAKLTRQYKSLCQKREQIQGFFRSTLDLELLFKLAGNPPVLKLSGMPDTHVKFRDPAAVRSYLKFLEWYKPDVHLIFGDFADCEGLSHWPSADLEPRRIVPEMKLARDLLQEIVNATPSTSTRLFLKGNHEDWIDQALGKMPELFEGLDDLGIEISVKKLLNLEKYGYEFYPLNELVQIGNAHFTHGIYHGDAHAKKHLTVFKCNIFYGHLHDNQTYNQTSIYGNMEAASNGCLCRLDAKFLKGRPNNWVQGHGAWEIFPDGTFVRYFIPIVGGKASFGGMVFDGNEA